MYIDWNTIILAGGVVTALGILLGGLSKVHKWILKQDAQSADIERLGVHHDEDIKHLKTENRLICFALSAALDGLIQLGANHDVPKAKEALDKYLNQQAHE